MEAGDGGISEEHEQAGADRDRHVERSRDGPPRIAALLGERGAVLPPDEHVKGEWEACRQAGEATGEVRPGERYRREVGAPIDEDDHTDHEHDRDLHEHGHAHRSGREADAARRQRDRADGQHQRQRFPRQMQRRVVRNGQRHHATRHREDPGDRRRVPHRDQQGCRHPGPRPQRSLDIGDEAPGRRLRLGELGHREGEQDDGHASRDDRQGGGHPGRDRDHPEREVEVDPGPDVGDRRGCQVRCAQLPGSKVVSALAHRL